MHRRLFASGVLAVAMALAGLVVAGPGASEAGAATPLAGQIYAGSTHQHGPFGIEMSANAHLISFAGAAWYGTCQGSQPETTVLPVGVHNVRVSSTGHFHSTQHDSISEGPGYTLKTTSSLTGEFRSARVARGTYSFHGVVTESTSSGSQVVATCGGGKTSWKASGSGTGYIGKTSPGGTPVSLDIAKNAKKVRGWWLAFTIPQCSDGSHYSSMIWFNNLRVRSGQFKTTETDHHPLSGGGTATAQYGMTGKFTNAHTITGTFNFILDYQSAGHSYTCDSGAGTWSVHSTTPKKYLKG